MEKKVSQLKPFRHREFSSENRKFNKRKWVWICWCKQNLKCNVTVKIEKEKIGIIGIVNKSYLDFYKNVK